MIITFSVIKPRYQQVLNDKYKMAATSVNALALDLGVLEGKSIPRFCHGNLKTENLFEVLNYLDAEGRTASTSKSKKKRRKTRGGRQRTSSEASGEEGNKTQPQVNAVDKQKVQYLDKLTNIIAAKAKAEWENQIRGFELLQKENQKLQQALKEKEKEFEKHKAELDIKRAEISFISIYKTIFSLIFLSTVSQ